VALKKFLLLQCARINWVKIVVETKRNCPLCWESGGKGEKPPPSTTPIHSPLWPTSPFPSSHFCPSIEGREANAKKCFTDDCTARRKTDCVGAIVLPPFSLGLDGSLPSLPPLRLSNLFFPSPPFWPSIGGGGRGPLTGPGDLATAFGVSGGWAKFDALLVAPICRRPTKGNWMKRNAECGSGEEKSQKGKGEVGGRQSGFACEGRDCATWPTFLSSNN
jgi:hypothetical protein